MKSILRVIAGAAFAWAFAGCGGESANVVCGDMVCGAGETASSCAEDCGCGNEVVNPGEDCDGTDVGAATCESVAQHGGTLGCNADCTFDVTDCDEYMCGDGIVDPGEECDGSDVGGMTCASVGFSDGAIACDASCRFDVTACCNSFCETANTSVCSGDTVESCVMQANGCLNLEIMDCALDDNVCDDSSGSAVCTCVDRCSAAGAGHCMGAVTETCTVQPDGCLDWVASTDCSTTGQACAVGPQGATCVSPVSGEDCNDPYPLVQGQNVVGWSATAADYLTSSPSCSTSTLTGPDVVLSYTATVNGIVTYSIAKPTNHRQAVVVSDAACGTHFPELSCAGNDFEDLTSMGGTFSVTLGSTYYFYIRDTTLGSSSLPSPLVLDLEEAACATVSNNVTNLAPANGGMVATSAPVLSFDIQHPVNEDVGVITLTGSLGTTLTFDLADSPDQVTFTADGRTMQIDPAASFLPSEVITVSWSGLVDELCGAPIPPPTWTFQISMPSCTPGMNGMVGTTMTRHSTSLASVSEDYVAADSDPNGYVYFGGTSVLYRMPKAGGEVEDLLDMAGITSTQLGYSMAIVGDKIFTLDTSTSSTTSSLWRLSTSGGVSWNPLGYSRYPMTAGASGYSLAYHSGRLYIAGNESGAGAPTQIWSVPASSLALPVVAVLEGTIVNQECDGLAVDDHYFYLTCSNDNNEIIRVDRTTFVPEVLTDQLPLAALKNDLQMQDFNGDGSADVLFVKTEDETVKYICGPGAAPPFWYDTFVDFGGPDTSGNYGLGFDPVGKVLWTFDDDTQELISIQ